MKYLIEVTENYRVDSEKEATALIEEAKQNQRQYSLSKYSSVQKERKSKGEVIDSWYRVSLTKKFTDEKEPYVWAADKKERLEKRTISLGNYDETTDEYEIDKTCPNRR